MEIFALALALFTGLGMQAESARLVDELGNDEWRIREKAHRRLLDMGTAGLPQLRLGLKSDDLERRRRCERIVSVITVRELWKPSKFSYKSEKRKVSDIISDLEKLTGHKLALNEGFKDVPLTLDLRDATYWDAVKEICKQSGNGLVSTFKFPVRSVALAGEPGEPFTSEGPAMGIFRGAQSFTGAYSAAGAGGPSMTFHFDVITEKKLALHGFIARPQLVSAVTDSGEELVEIAPPMQWSYASPHRSIACENLFVEMRKPRKPFTKITKLEVKIQLAAYMSGAVPATWPEREKAAHSSRELVLVFEDVAVSFPGDKK